MKTNTTKKRKKGFTLLEMIVVIAIIAIIGAIVILPNVNAIKTVRTGVDNENTKVLETAFKQYYVDFDTFPANTATGTVDLLNNNNPLNKLVSTNYLKSIPIIQSKKKNGKYNWTIEDIKPDTGDISIECK